MRCDPSRSPDASPATTPMVSGASGIPAALPDDAAGGARQKIEQRLDFRAILDLAREFPLGLLERETGLVKRFVRPLQARDHSRPEAAPFQSLGIDAKGPSRVARGCDIGRHILQDDRADRGEAVGANMAK